MYCKLRRLELLRLGQLSDCVLIVWSTDSCKRECSREFNCHKVMLASASEVFEREFRERETNGNEKVVINVNDATPEAYETLLLYIYTYEIYNDITIEMCADLVFLATKYKMPDFIEGYISKLANKNWPIYTVLKIFQLASENDRPVLMKLVAKKIVPIASKLLHENCFLKFSVKELYALMVILKDSGTVPRKELLLALKRYQDSNNLHYNNMEAFQQFVEVTRLFGDHLFEPDGTLATTDEMTEDEPKESTEPSTDPAATPDEPQAPVEDQENIPEKATKDSSEPEQAAVEQPLAESPKAEEGLGQSSERRESKDKNKKEKREKRESKRK